MPTRIQSALEGRREVFAARSARAICPLCGCDQRSACSYRLRVARVRPAQVPLEVQRYPSRPPPRCLPKYRASFRASTHSSNHTPVVSTTCFMDETENGGG